MSALLVLGLIAATDACTRVEPAPRPDPTTASAYLAVAREELSRGEERSAAAAFREALRFGPSSREAREGLERSCRHLEALDEEAAFERAVALMEGGDRSGAVEGFEALRRGRVNRGAALLEGICLYELGDDTRAQTVLLEAKEDPELAATAELFLGLLALRRGEGRNAEEHFGRASRGEPSLSATAARLRALSVREGKLVGVARASGGYDSNVELVPVTGAAPSGSGDVSLLAELLLLARPWGQSGPYAVVSGSYRKQLVLGAYDTGLAAGTAGWQLAKGQARASLDYTLEYLAFGGAPSILAHVLGLRGELPVGPLGLEAAYSVRFQDFLAAENAGYSGTLHAGRLSLAVRPSERWGLEVGVVVTRDAARLAELASFAYGPVLVGWVDARDDVRLLASAAYRRRRHDAFDLDFELVRADQAVELSTHLEVDLGRVVTLFTVLEARFVASNVEDLTSWRVAAWLGAAFSTRLF